MAELKKAVNKMEEQGIPRAVLSEGILTIDVDSHVETMEEQEDARWHQLLNAHRTKKILTGQLGGIEKLDSGWTVAITYYNGFRIITDVYKGTYFIRLNIGVNAVAHSCNMASLPSKRDEVGFVVTRINDKFEVAEGIITRMIKRGA